MYTNTRALLGSMGFSDENLDVLTPHLSRICDAMNTADRPDLWAADFSRTLRNQIAGLDRAETDYRRALHDIDPADRLDLERGIWGIGHDFGSIIDAETRNPAGLDPGDYAHAYGLYTVVLRAVHRLTTSALYAIEATRRNPTRGTVYAITDHGATVYASLLAEETRIHAALGSRTRALLKECTAMRDGHAPAAAVIVNQATAAIELYDARRIFDDDTIRALALTTVNYFVLARRRPGKYNPADLPGANVFSNY